MYYLNSRYYDPAVGRFINPDSFISTGQGLAGFNMYSYCNNNPILYVDGTGNLPIVENDDTYYPEAFCEYLNAFGYKKQEQNVAAFNAETISEYLNGAASGMSYAEYEAHKIASISAKNSDQYLAPELGSIYDFFFSNFYSNGESGMYEVLSSSIQHSDALIFGYGAVSGLIDKYVDDYRMYGYSNRDMCIAVVVSSVFSVGEATLSIAPATKTVSGVLSVTGVYAFAEEVVTFAIVLCFNCFD